MKDDTTLLARNLKIPKFENTVHSTFLLPITVASNNRDIRIQNEQ